LLMDVVEVVVVVEVAVDVVGRTGAYRASMAVTSLCARPENWASYVIVGAMTESATLEWSRPRACPISWTAVWTRSIAAPPKALPISHTSAESKWTSPAIGE